MNRTSLIKIFGPLKLTFFFIFSTLVFIQPCLACTPAQATAPYLPTLPNTQYLSPNTYSIATTKYLIDPNRSLPSVLAETDASGNITCYYVYGLGLISKIEGNNAYYYQYDGLGSTVAITDSTGAVKNKYAYDDFGNLATNSTETISNPFKYVGRYGVITDLPDLLYMRARYYMPSIGRFINEDPIGLAGGLNMYGYVGANPIGLVDPLGLKAELPIRLMGYYITAAVGIGATFVSSPAIGTIAALGVGMIWTATTSGLLNPANFMGAFIASSMGFSAGYIAGPTVGKISSVLISELWNVLMSGGMRRCQLR